MNPMTIIRAATPRTFSEHFCEWPIGLHYTATWRQVVGPSVELAKCRHTALESESWQCPVGRSMTFLNTLH